MRPALCCLLLLACGPKTKSPDRVIVATEEPTDATAAPTPAVAVVDTEVDLWTRDGVLWLDEDAVAAWPPTPDELEGRRIVPLHEALLERFPGPADPESPRIATLHIAAEGGLRPLREVVYTLGMAGIQTLQWRPSEEEPRVHRLALPELETGEQVGWMTGVEPLLVLYLRENDAQVWAEASIGWIPTFTGDVEDPGSRPADAWDPRKGPDCAALLDDPEAVAGCSERVATAPRSPIGCPLPPTEPIEARTSWPGQLVPALDALGLDVDHAVVVASPALNLALVSRVLDELADAGVETPLLGGSVRELGDVRPTCAAQATPEAIATGRALALGAQDVARGRQQAALAHPGLDGAVQAALPDVRRCFRTALQDQPGLAGTIEVALTIAADGSIARRELSLDTLADPTVGACVLDVFGALTFPPPPDGARIEIAYPFVFRPET